MNKVVIAILLYSLLFFTACSQSGNNNKSMKNLTLQSTDHVLKLPLDEWTKDIIYPQQVTDNKTGKKYLAFQNDLYPQLLFYEKETGKLAKKIDLVHEGDNGVNRFSSFLPKSMDEIYLINNEVWGITIINGEGKPIKFIPGKSVNSGQQVICNSNTFDLLGDSIYFGIHVDHENPQHERMKKSSLCAVLDLNTKTFYTPPVSYFDITQQEGEEDDHFNIYFPFRCYNKNRNTFVYSFIDLENIYETDKAHTTIRKIKAKSKYLTTRDIEKVKFSMVYDIAENTKKDIAKGRYWSIHYDPYRHVYYRIVIPPSDIPDNVHIINFYQNGGHSFAIMILDEDFNIIDEVMLPKDTYVPSPIFVDEDGLYICENHILNPNYSDDVCPFRRFELVPKK